MENRISDSWLRIRSVNAMEAGENEERAVYVCVSGGGGVSHAYIIIDVPYIIELCVHMYVSVSSCMDKALKVWVFERRAHTQLWESFLIYTYTLLACREFVRTLGTDKAKAVSIVPIYGHLTTSTHVGVI